MSLMPRNATELSPFHDVMPWNSAEFPKNCSVILENVPQKTGALLMTIELMLLQILTSCGNKV